MSRKWSALILFKQTDKKHRGGVAWSCGGALLSSVGAAWLNSYCCQTCSTSSGFYGWGDKMKASQSQSGWSVFWGKRWWSEELSPGQSLCLWSQPGLGLYPKESQRGERGWSGVSSSQINKALIYSPYTDLMLWVWITPAGSDLSSTVQFWIVMEAVSISLLRISTLLKFNVNTIHSGPLVVSEYKWHQPARVPSRVCQCKNNICFCHSSSPRRLPCWWPLD